MIKNIFSKKLLYILLWLLVIFLIWSFNSSDAWYTNSIWSKVDSPFDNSLELWVLSKWTLITNRLWQGKNVFSPKSLIDDNEFNPSSKILYFFWNNKKPYIYAYRSSSSFLQFQQWYLTQYSICDKLNWSETSMPSNCTVTSLSDSSIPDFEYFFWTVNSSDYYYWDYSDPGTQYANHYLVLCVSSNQVWKSLCFYGWCNGWSSMCQDLTWSIWLMPKLSFSDLSSYVLQNSPWLWNTPEVESWNTIEGPVVWEVENLGGDIVYWKCTNWSLLNYYRQNFWFSDVICYGWLPTFDYYEWNYTVTPWQWLTVFDLEDYYFSGTHDYWFEKFWNGVYYNIQLCRQWDSFCPNYPTVFSTYFDILDYNYMNWWWRETYNYCSTLLETNFNDEINFNNLFMSEDDADTICKRIVNNNTSTNYQTNSWSAVSNNLNGVWSIWQSNSTGENFSWTNIVDWTNFINSYINKLKEQLQIDKSNNIGWIIPSYIIWFLLAIIVFRFLRK